MAFNTKELLSAVSIRWVSTFAPLPRKKNYSKWTTNLLQKPYESVWTQNSAQLTTTISDLFIDEYGYEWLFMAFNTMEKLSAVLIR